MKICICGTHGVGKSTLVKKVHEITKIPIITEIARSIAEQYGIQRANELMTLPYEKRFEYQWDIFRRQIMAESYINRYISDRSVLDVVVYSELYRLNYVTVNEMCFKALEHLKGVDLLVYCPIPEDYTTDITDKFRLSYGQEFVANRLWDYLYQVPCPVLRLPPNREKWAEILISIVRKEFLNA